MALQTCFFQELLQAEGDLKFAFENAEKLIIQRKCNWYAKRVSVM